MEMRMTWDIKQFMMRWLMAHNYGEYDDGGDESGDANPNWRYYDRDDVNADNAGADDVDDEYDTDADSYVDAGNNDGWRKQWIWFC